jgi:hypothetical protein
MSKDKRRREALKKFIVTDMSENPRISELIAHIDRLPSEYIEELYRELEVIEPLKVMGMQAMTSETTRKLKNMIDSSLRYHE